MHGEGICGGNPLFYIDTPVMQKLEYRGCGLVFRVFVEVLQMMIVGFLFV